MDPGPKSYTAFSLSQETYNAIYTKSLNKTLVSHLSPRDGILRPCVCVCVYTRPGTHVPRGGVIGLSSLCVYI